MKKLENLKNAFLIGVCILAAILSAFYPFEDKVVQTAGSLQTLDGKTSEQRLAFFASNDVSVESEPSEISDVLIPSEFTATYQRYEALQKAQGLSLEEYKGEKVKRYSYHLKDNKNALAELLVFEGKIVAAAIVDLSENGAFSKIIA